MDISPQQSPNDDDQKVQEALQRREQAILDAGTTKVSASQSWGEHLLPFLFAAMETCWIDAILIALATLISPRLDSLLMPLWAPFVLLLGGSWLLTSLERRDLLTISSGHQTNSEAGEAGSSAVTGSSLFYVLMSVAILIIVWASIYASSNFLIDPRWLLALINDLLLLSPQAFHVLGIVLLSVFLCWRGMQIGRNEVEPGGVYNELRLGMGIILAILIFRANVLSGTAAGLVMLLLMPIFLALALVTHSLARAVFTRKTHPAGLQGSVILQERSVLWVVGTVGVILLVICLSLGTIASPTMLMLLRQALSPIATLYDWLVTIFVQVVVWLLTPLFWLFEHMHFQSFSLTPVKAPPICKPPRHCTIPPQTPPPAVLATASVLKVLIPILIVALVVFLIWLALRRRRIALVRNARRFEELHESLWSWELFWAQLKAFLLAIWRRFFPLPVAEAAPVVAEEISGEPAARSIREIYRALLVWAFKMGLPRKKDETPYEFRVRLNEHLPHAEPELEAVTQAYSAVRYGGIVPNEEELAGVQGNWMALQQKGHQA